MAVVKHWLETGRYVGGGSVVMLETDIFTDKEAAPILIDKKLDSRLVHISTRVDNQENHTSLDIGRGYFDLPFKRSKESIHTHLNALEYILKKIGEDYIQDPTIYRRGNNVLVNKEGINATLITKMRFPNMYFPEGIVISGQFVDELVLKSELKNGKNITSICDSDNNLILQKEYDKTDIIISHNNEIQKIENELKGQYEYFFNNYSSEHIAEHQIGHLTHVDYWDAKHSDMLNSAQFIINSINKSPLSGSIEDTILYGSLARNDKIPGDIDLILIVNNTKVLDPMSFSTEERKKSSHLRSYCVDDVTDGLSKELGIFKELKKYALDTYPNDIKLNRWRYDEPHRMPFGKFGATMNLNSFYLEDLKDSATMENLMRNKITPAYWKDVINDGLILKDDEFIPAKVKYRKELDVLNRILDKAIREDWPNHKNDHRFRFFDDIFNKQEHGYY